MPLTTPQLRRFVRRTLVTAAGANRPTHAQLGAAFDLLCHGLTGQLQPLFGGAAVAALFARAHHLTATEFPWLGDVIPAGGGQCSPHKLEAAAGEILQEGLAALLANEIGLLSAFIGEDFVLPMVQEAWSAAAASDSRGSSESDS
jgi:hypothetical protein